MPLTPFIPCPATGAAFIGREGLVRNLREHIAKGDSVAVIGGPKLGKPSLVRTALDGLSDRTVIEMDLGADSSPGWCSAFCYGGAGVLAGAVAPRYAGH